MGLAREALDRSSSRAMARLQLDEVTLRRAQRGDRDACTALVVHHQALVFSVISRLLMPAGLGDRVEDLAQECFLRVYKSLSSFDLSGSAALSTWIATIATRLAIDELRRKRPVLAEDELAELPVGITPLVSASTRQIRSAIARAVMQLKPETQAAFVLFELEGFSLEEIAGIVDAPVGTVKSRLHRARTTLREVLKEYRDD